MGDDPPYLTVGTEVSAKYKGAFCEAKIRKVVRVVKCKVTFKSGLGGALLSDDFIKGSLRVGANVEAKHSEKNQFCEATINKIQDCSQYTVVFDDGDITTLRRSALCLKSGRHFNESETLDQLPLTHPEHFSNPVVGGRRGAARRRAANTDADKDDSSDEEETPSQKKKKGENAGELGKVVCVEISEKKKGKDSWFPALVVCPAAQETVKIRVKDEFLVRSFKDGRYYTVPKKEISAFVKETYGKQETNSSVLKSAVEKAISYLDKDELPPHWDRDVLFGTLISDQSDDEGSEEKDQDDKDRFIAQLYQFMGDRGTPINKIPVICGKDLNLYKLYNVVTDKGGYHKVSTSGQWKPITIKSGFGAMPSTSTINLVKQAYKRLLYEFEDFKKKLGNVTVHMLPSTSGKPRNSRGIYRGGSAAVSKDPKKEDPEEKPAEKEKEKKAAPPLIDPETDSTSMDSDGKKSEQSDEPRRSRSRQEVKTAKREATEDDKSPEKSTPGKKKSKKVAKEVEKEPVKEEPPIPKAEPPSPAPSQVSQGSKKGRGSRKRKEKDEEPPVITEPVEPVAEGLSKDVKVELGDKLRVYYPKGDKNVTYEAKVVDANEKNGSFLVHYTGWNNRYDEWIERDRISENASLRMDYQPKSQGKGPQTQQSSSEAKDSESSGSSVVKTPKTHKKVPRTTPSLPTSSTGTRSKTGTIKRKRLSAEYEEPVKKKRVVKKDKDAPAETEATDSEPRNPPRTSTISPDVSSASSSPIRIPKASKEKVKDLKEKPVEEDKSASSVKEPAVKGGTETVEKDKQTQKIDMIQIRSEMKGLDKIVKSKSPPSQPPSTPSQSPSSSSNSAQKLDIYDFEEDNEAPKLKMFSPRSPDKKDDSSKPEVSPGTSATKTTTSPEIKTKEVVPPPTTSAVSTPVSASTPAKPEMASSTKKEPKVVAVAAVLAPLSTATTGTVPRPVTPTIAPVVTPSPAPVLATVVIPRQVVPHPNVTLRANMTPEPSLRVRLPVDSLASATSPPRSRAPTAPPPLVPSSSVLLRAASPTGIAQGPAVTPHVAVPVLIPKPATPVISALRLVAPSGSTPLISSTPSGAKDAKLLPFVTRKQELFPHLIQQTQQPPASEPKSAPTTEHKPVPHPPVTVHTEKVVPSPAISSVTQHPVPYTASVSKPPVTPSVPKPSVSVPASSDPKKEKKKRIVAKKTDLKVTPSPRPEPPLEKSPAKKRAKPGTAKAAKALLALKTDPKVKVAEPKSSTPAVTKPPETIPQSPAVVFKQSEHSRKTPGVSKPSTPAVSKPEKRPTSMKQTFMKGLASLEKEQRAEAKSQAPGAKAAKAKEEKEKTAAQAAPSVAIIQSQPAPEKPTITVAAPPPPQPKQAQAPPPSVTSAPTPSKDVGPSASVPVTATVTKPLAVITTPKSSVVVIESLASTVKTPQAAPVPQAQAENTQNTPSKPVSSKPIVPDVPVAVVTPPQALVPKATPQKVPVPAIALPVEQEKKPMEPAPSVKVVQSVKEPPRPLTPSFLTSNEQLGPEEPEETRKSAGKTPKRDMEGVKKEEESCSSLLCEEEIPGSPTADDEDKEKPRFDFSEEKVEKSPEKEVVPPPQPVSTGARVRGLNTNRLEAREKKHKAQHQQEESYPDKPPSGPSFSSALPETTPPSTPESTTLSTETGGSPHVDGGRVSPSGEGGSSKSKESTDGDSGDGSKNYYGPGERSRKSRKSSPPPSPGLNKRSRESRGRNVSPPAKRRRIPRKKSPEEMSTRPFSYRGGRSSSGRKHQSGSDTHEVVRAAPPPPPINLVLPEKDSFNIIPILDDVDLFDVDERTRRVSEAIAKCREIYAEKKAFNLALEKKERKAKKKLREKAAAEKAARTRQEVAKILASV